MPRIFDLRTITPGELTNIDLKHEAQRQMGNSTLATYRTTVDRETAHGEVLYIGDQRIAVVAWKGNVCRCEQVESPREAFDQVLQKLGA